MPDDQEQLRGLQTRSELQERLSTNQETWFCWLFDRLLETKTADPGTGRRTLRILELAAGTGALWASNRVRIPECWQVVISDAAAAMVRATRSALEHLGQSTGQFDFMVADVQAIPLRDGRWDVVLANGVFDYLTQERRQVAFREIRRILAPGGRLLTVTGGRGHLRELEDLARPFVNDPDYGGDPAAFGMENGAAQLAENFVNVQLFPYEDTLVFAHVEPLMAYLQSEPEVDAQLHEAGRAGLARHVEEELAARGEIRATERKGLFVVTVRND